MDVPVAGEDVEDGAPGGPVPLGDAETLAAQVRGRLSLVKELPEVLPMNQLMKAPLASSGLQLHQESPDRQPPGSLNGRWNTRRILMDMRVGAVATLLIAGAAGCGSPTSPGGVTFELIYRGRLANGDGGFIVMSPDGSSKRILARPTEAPFCASMSPDGKRLLYNTMSPNRIVTLDVATGRETYLTDPGTESNECPAWAPDGSRIAFYRGPVAPFSGFAVYFMNADGSNVRELAPEGYAANGMDWSPDGKWLAVVGIDHRLVLLDATTGALVRLLTATGFAYDPQFSPDGSQIAYAFSSSGAGEIYVSNVHGGNVRRLTTVGPNDSHNRARWSPNGTLLAYWGFVPDTLPLRIVPAIKVVTSAGIPVPWKRDAEIFGDGPFWRVRP